MYARQVHDSLDQPPAVAMFSRETKQKSSHGQSEVIISVVDKIMQCFNSQGQTLSPIRKAELRSTYIKQLKNLHENGILNTDEYEEQREELIELMRQLKNVH